MKAWLSKENIISFLILAAGFGLALALFRHASMLQAFNHPRGDAMMYFMVAESFTSLSDALYHIGYTPLQYVYFRPCGMAVFLYLIRELYSPDFYEWARMTSYVQFTLHVITCILFYFFFLRKLFQQAKLPFFCAPVLAAMALAYPAIVTSTTVQLTDVFSSDLLLLAAALYGSRNSALNARFVATSLLCGLIIGYAITVRPSFWPPTIMLYAALFCQAFTASKDRRILAIGIVIMGLGTLAPVLQTAWTVWEARGIIGLRDERFNRATVRLDTYDGLANVRGYWITTNPSQQPTPGIRDPFLYKTYTLDCEVDSPLSLVQCLLSKPWGIPAFIAKKNIALFDEPYMNSYAVDVTPRWFTHLSRLFSVFAFCGFISLAGMTALYPWLAQKPVWIGLPWVAFVLTLLAQHNLFHVEGRYGFPAIAFSLASLFLAFAAARKAGEKILASWFIMMVLAGILFLYQVTSWDSVAPM